MFYDQDAREVYGYDTPDYNELQEINAERYEDQQDDHCEDVDYPYYDDDDSEYDTDTDLYGEFYDWE